MSASGDAIRRRLPDREPARRKNGIYVRRDGDLVRVNVGDRSVSLRFAGLMLPPPGHPVELEQRDQEVVVTGPARPLPTEGTVTVAGSPRATVNAWGVDYVLRINPAYTPVIGDLVTIQWGTDEGTIIGKQSAAAASSSPSENGGGGVTRYHPAPFRMIDSGTYRAGAGWWTRTVRANVDDGAWFPGAKIKHTIPDSARIISARIYLPVISVVIAADGQLRLHTHATKPVGAPTFTGSAVPVEPHTGWVPVPTSWIDVLKAGDGGIGFDGGGQWVCAGTDTDALSGALDIIYEA